ncbi:MAG: KEOPS complex subunit Pcc1 [Candidatus Thorarchaeota archaeon]|jgi:tRNA threonylcarbamoyladenosine modification (KEOPS) complex  Pcc1 subunit
MLAEIQLEFESNEDATHVLNAIKPDNSPLPPGIAIQTSVEANRLLIRIECERGIDSLRATVEDIMSAIDLSVRTINTVE